MEMLSATEKRTGRVGLIEPLEWLILTATEKRAGRVGPIFSIKGRRLGQNILNVTIARLGHPCVGHGFRSTFRDWCGDHAVQPSYGSARRKASLILATVAMATIAS